MTHRQSEKDQLDCLLALLLTKDAGVCNCQRNCLMQMRLIESVSQLPDPMLQLIRRQARSSITL